MQLEFDFTPKKPKLSLVPPPVDPPRVEEAPPVVTPQTEPPPSNVYRFPVLSGEDRSRYNVVWPPPVARSDVLDHRLEEDSFADELFALGPFPATNGPSAETRPTKRSECAAVPRPCPFVSCRHHLYLDVRVDGSLKLNFPNKEPDELAVSCSLDLADDGPRTLDAIAAVMGMSKERARQIESEAFDKLYVSLPRAYDADMSIEDEWV